MTLLPTASSPAKKSRSSKSIFRNTTRCLKLTQDEARLLDEVATVKGVPRSEWMAHLAASQTVNSDQQQHRVIANLDRSSAGA
jgi:hypothetical protein